VNNLFKCFKILFLKNENNKIKIKEIKIQKWISILGWLCFILVIVGFIVGAYGYSAYDMRWDKGLESFGNFASGTVVGIWSLAGVILIFIAFLGQKFELQYQKEELILNRKELEETRMVMNEQKKEFELQNKYLLEQNLSNHFFQLLKNYNEIVYNMDIGHDKYRKVGRDCFNTMYHDFKSLYNNMFISKNSEYNRVEISYLEFYEDNQSDLGNYYRNLYHLIKYIDKSTIENKQFYINIVRAQLSTYELGLLFYNGLSSYGNQKLKPLIERYNLIKNLPKNVLIKTEHAEFYSGIKFEEDERI